jgi:hypothetical protein
MLVANVLVGVMDLELLVFVVVVRCVVFENGIILDENSESSFQQQTVNRHRTKGRPKSDQKIAQLAKTAQHDGKQEDGRSAGSIRVADKTVGQRQMTMVNPQCFRVVEKSGVQKTTEHGSWSRERKGVITIQFIVL